MAFYFKYCVQTLSKDDKRFIRLIQKFCENLKFRLRLR